MKDVLRSFKADIRMLQETKLSSMSDSTVKEIWGASTGDNWICCESIGASRGILVMCNRVIFTKKYEWIEAFSASILLDGAKFQLLLDCDFLLQL